MPVAVPDDANAVWAKLWPEPATTTRGRPPRWTLSDFVDAGIRIADRGGLDAVTVASVSAEVGGSPMSIYRHIASKDELLVLIEDAALGPPPPLTGSDGAEEGWREALGSWAVALGEVYDRRPWLPYVPSFGPPAGPNQLAWLDAALYALRGLDVGGLQRLALVLLLSGHIRNASRTVVEMGPTVSSDGLAGWFAFLAARVGDRLPNLATTMRDIAVSPEIGADWDHRSFMLDRVLDDISHLTPPSD